MSRVIKFRAWVPGDHWVAQQEKKPNGFYVYDWQATIYVEACCFQPSEDDGIILEQFTGLLDKNGKEIYEGDIVKCVPRGCPHEIKWFNDNGGTYGGGMPGFNMDGLSRNLGAGYAWTGEEEVIGNIHEEVANEPR